MTSSKKLSSIPLEQPPSLRRQELGAASVAWTIPAFVVGHENALLAFLFSKRQLAKLGQLSPIILFGPQASGKTALAITLATLWSRHTDQRPLLFTTGAAFASDFQEALDADDVEHFRRRHRRCRLLVIDDIDCLATKPAAQEELIVTLDSMLELQRPVILTASRLPSTIRGFRPGLASRFHAGFSLELALPSSETVARLLELMVAAIDPLLPCDELRSCLVKANSKLTVPQLLEIVHTASQQRKLYGQFNSTQLRQLSVAAASKPAPDLNTIAKAVARRFHLTLTELRSPTRLARVVRARGLVILLARRLTTISLQQIGDYFGGRDHSTILHAYRKLEDSLHSDPELSQAVLDLQHQLATSRVD